MTQDQDIDKEIERLARKRWYVQGLSACNNYSCVGPYSGIEGLWRELGYGYNEMVGIFVKNYVDYHYSEDDLEEVGERFFKEYRKDHAYLEEVMAKDARKVRAFRKAVRTVEKTDLKTVTKEELLSIYHMMAHAYTGLLDVSHIIEAASLVLEQRLRAAVQERTGIERHSPEFQRLFSGLVQPERPSFINAEQDGLARIVRAIRKQASLRRLFLEKSPQDILRELDPVTLTRIRKHQRRHYYNQVDYYNGGIMPEAQYVAEIKKTLEGKGSPHAKPAAVMAKESKERREAIIAEHDLGDEVKEFIELGVRMLHWQDDRKKNLLCGVFFLNLLLDRIAETRDIPLELLKRYLPDELTEDLLERFKEHEGEAKARMELSIAVFKRGISGMDVHIYTDETAERIIKEFKKKEKQEQMSINGMPASRGKASGMVKVCRTKEDFAGFEEGMVLVTSMTRPEFVPLMKKAAAIVTDEGGITCHAAIVSRELGVPCVIGTKVATKVLKDGDLVEVNANHGQVRKVEK
jgi:phosphohistidine swiveling domain-containing protein